MPISFVALAAAATFACVNPTHHDGDNVRCDNVDQSIRLQGIDAPEMPGSCRPGRACTSGDPYAARDFLRSVSRGQTLQCTQEDTDNYGRIIARCSAGGTDLSCAMIASGQAAARYAAIDCGGSGDAMAAAAESAASSPSLSPMLAAPLREPPPVRVPADLPAHSAYSGSAGIALIVLIALALINAITWALFALDKRRAQAGRSRERIAERTLLGWAALGGSPAAWHAITTLRHKSSKESFRLRLMLICGVQAGVAIGAAWLWIGS